jgi:adenylate kinase family enzyme
MKRIIVVGTSGSGKTTLANKISEITCIEHLELDSIYNQSNWTPIETDKFLATVNDYTDKEAWIICGNYFSRLGIGFWEKADVVIWLDYPFNVVFRRVVTRSFRRGITRQVLWNGNRESLLKNFFSKKSVILHMIKTWRKQNERYAPIFSKGRLGDTKLIRLSNDNEITSYLKSIQSGLNFS